MAKVVEDAFNIGAVYLNFLNMHFVFADGWGVDGFECSGTDMEGDEVGGNAFAAKRLEDFRREMKTCGRCSDGALMLGIYCLVTFVIAAYGFAVEIGWQGDDTGLVNQVGKTESAVPVEVYNPSIADSLTAGGSEGDGLPLEVELTGKGAFLPLLIIANEADPCAMLALLERKSHGHLIGFETKDLNGRASGLAEEKAGMDNLSVVEDQQGVGWEKVGNMVETTFGDSAATVDKKFGVVATFERELGDAVVGQGIVVGVYGDVFYVVHGRKFAQK